MQSQNFTAYEHLYKWSITQRAEFWQAAIAAVKIKFAQPATKILDLALGVAKPNWLVGAKLNIVTSCFQAEPSKVAIVYKNANTSLQTVTYGELHSLANRVSNSLVALGCKPGDAIAIDMVMTAEAVAIYLGIIQAGCVVVGIADSFAAAEVVSRVELSKAKLIFTQDIIVRAGKTLPLYEKIAPVLNIKTIVIPALDDKLSVSLLDKDVSWQNFLLENNNFTPVICEPHSASNILFSSGTSGQPKAIVWDHTSPIKCAVDGYLYQDIQPHDIVAWPTSLGWMMGPWLIYATLINQATIALYYDAPTSRKFLEFIAAAKVTVLGLVPVLVRDWRKNNYLEDLDLTNIKLFSSTGETSNTSDMQYLIEQSGGKPIIEYCGGTEISGAYITSTLLHQNIPATFSTPALGLDLKLIDTDGKFVEQGEVALVPPSIGLSRELLNRDNFTEYYADMPKLQDGTVLRRHGDQMQHLANGYYKSLGRADDTMNLGGIKISSAEIEHCLSDIPEIHEAAAIGVTRAAGVTELIIYVVPATADKLDLAKLQQQIQAAINTKLNPLFRLSEVKLIDKLPRTSSNKIMRRLLRDTTNTS